MGHDVSQEGAHGPFIIGRTRLTSPGVASDPKRVQQDWEAQVAADNEREAARSGPLVVRCGRCPDWRGQSIEDQSAHMHEVHGIEPVSKEGKYAKRCPGCARTFHTDIASVKFCGDACRAKVQAPKQKTPLPTCERCGKPCARSRNRFCSKTCAALSQHVARTTSV